MFSNSTFAFLPSKFLFDLVLKSESELIKIYRAGKTKNIITSFCFIYQLNTHSENSNHIT